MADIVNVLDQFTALVNSVPVADSTQPILPPVKIMECDLVGEVNALLQGGDSIHSGDSADFGIAQVHAAYASGELNARQLVEGLLSRIETREPLIQGWVSIAPDVLTSADNCDQSMPALLTEKPLLGIPIGIKDLIDVAGLPTLCGSRQASNELATNDSSAIARLRDAGAIIMGKTTTHEYAFGGTTPPTRNPWQPDTVPGGSSGGSGAVLGAGMVPGAIGTDTAGSVRIPASYCGVVGFMGSHGHVPTDNVAVLAWSLDHVGAMARSVTDAARIHRVMAGLPVDPSAIAPSAIAPSAMAPMLPALPQTMGIPREALEPMHPSVRTAFDLTVDALRAHGVTFVDVPWPDPELLEAVGFVLMMAESAAFHQNRMRSPELFDPQVAELLEAGSTVSAMDHLQALRVQTQLAQWFDELFVTTPILITPTLPCLPPPLGSDTFTPIDLGSVTQPLATAHTRFTLAANIAGSPAGSLPCGLQQGFPVGLQVMGRRGSDLRVLSVMGGIESVLAHENLWQPGSISNQFGGC